MKQRLKLLIAVVLFGLTHTNAQDPQFSQFYNMGIYYNPANTCLDNDIQATLAMRKQWMSIDGGLSNYYASAETKLNKKRVYLSLLFFNETVKDYISTNRAELIYTWRAIDATKYKLQFGLTLFSLNQKKFDYNKLVFSDQLDPVYGMVNPTEGTFDKDENVFYADWNVGGVFKGKEKRYGNIMLPTLGFSWQHVTAPRISSTGQDTRLDRKIIAFAELPMRYTIKSSNASNRKDLYIKPAVFYEGQGTFNSLTFGSSFEAYSLSLGFWLRTWDVGAEVINTIIFSMGVDVPISMEASAINQSALRISYSYDATSSDLEFASGGTHEINLRYLLDYKIICKDKGVSWKDVKKFK